MTIADLLPPYPRIGGIDRLSPDLEAIVAPDAPIELLAEGFIWSEGPVWIREGGYLLLSDVPGNVMYRWSVSDGISEFLNPSGYDGPPTRAFREPGSNGMVPGPPGTVLLCDHGNRAVAQLDLATKRKTFLATAFRGKRFNSPNDLVRARDGAIYFTDPPYGLEGLNDSPLRELPFNGIYRLGTDGIVTLLDDSVSFPNGIILAPDERTLYVSCSDPERATWIAYALDEKGLATDRRLFADLTASVGDDLPGLPDGMAIDRSGVLFATGPGGVILFDPDGGILARIATGTAIANCTFGEDGSTLFLAAHHMLARVRTRTVGLGF